MNIRIERILPTAFIVEALTVATLILVVALFGPAEQDAAQAYAKQLGFYIGPIGGFIFCLLGAWWVARKLTHAHILNGFILGLAVAIIDISILLASGPEFHPLFIISNIGRVVAGTLGGWFATQHMDD